MLNLDTHVVIFAVTGQLNSRETALLDKEAWSMSSIVMWEIAKLAQLGRIDIDLYHPGVVQVLERLHIWPIDLDAARASAQLDFRSDPADELIAATSIVHGVPLVTRDRVLRASALIPLA